MKLDPDALKLMQTHFFTLGSSHNFSLTDNQKYLYFTRSASDTSAVHSLWRINTQNSNEEVVFNPLKHAFDESLTPEEEKQRERLRETSTGVTNYNISRNGNKLCFTSSGQLWLVDLQQQKTKAFRHIANAFDPRFSPNSKKISYVNSKGLWVIDTDFNAKPVQLVANESPNIYYGQAEFIASEEFERYRGHWWSPDSKSVISCRVDETNIMEVHAIESNPRIKPSSSKYPLAGTANAKTSLYIINIKSKDKRLVTWDSETLPYLLNVQWRKAGLFITTQSRNQKTLTLLEVDTTTGITKAKLVQTDPSWVDVVQPLPYVSDDGHIITTTGNKKQKRGLSFNGKLLTPADHHVDDFLGLTGNWLVYTAAVDPKERVVFAVHKQSKTIKQLSPSNGLYSAIVSNMAIYVSGAAADSFDKIHMLYKTPANKPKPITISSHSSKPLRLPQPIFFTSGPEKLQSSLILPEEYDQDKPLPILIQVYGGPHHQEVIYSSRSFLESQWWANQGYAVLSTDGPGTPGRDLAWERSIQGDFIEGIAKAQITALKSALKEYPFLDKNRVATRGWSFGGYLSAFLSILYADFIHASISGAPVTDWRLYDTHYTERYLGDAETHAGNYDKSSLVNAARTSAARPILLIHGLQDDNVLPSNSLQLIEALNKARCPYQFIPLNDASHFSKQAEQRVWLLQMEKDFLAKNI